MSQMIVFSVEEFDICCNCDRSNTITHIKKPHRFNCMSYIAMFTANAGLKEKFLGYLKLIDKLEKDYIRIREDYLKLKAKTELEKEMKK